MISGSPSEVDAQRARWDRYRRDSRMVLPIDGDFANGGLAALIDNLDIRLLFLAADPLADLVPLLGETIEWLKQPVATPLGAAPAVPRGLVSRPATEALLLCDLGRGGDQCQQYFAIHRHGGLETAANSWTFPGERQERTFRLRPTVRQIWELASKQREAIDRWLVPGPYEVTLALARTEGATLGQFASGWGGGNVVLSGDAPLAFETNMLIRLEFDDLPDPVQLATDLGDRMQQGFGSLLRRHLVRGGTQDGQLTLEQG